MEVLRSPRAIGVDEYADPAKRTSACLPGIERERSFFQVAVERPCQSISLVIIDDCQALAFLQLGKNFIGTEIAHLYGRILEHRDQRLPRLRGSGIGNRVERSRNGGGCHNG